MPWWIIILLLIYFVFCLLLMGVILIQAGKGGGLSSLGASSSGIADAIGSTGAEKTLNKITTVIAVGFFVLAIILSIWGSAGNKGGGGVPSGVFERTQPTATTGFPEVPLSLPGDAPSQPPLVDDLDSTINIPIEGLPISIDLQPEDLPGV